MTTDAQTKALLQKAEYNLSIFQENIEQLFWVFAGLAHVSLAEVKRVYDMPESSVALKRAKKRLQQISPDEAANIMKEFFEKLGVATP